MNQQAHRLFISLSLLGLAGIATPARAEVTSFKVTYRAPFGKFGELDYILLEAKVDGTVQRMDGTSGTYSIPAILIYPMAGTGNGHGWVELPNTSFFENYPRSNSCNKTFCDNYSFASPCETRGDFLCEQPGSVPMSDNKYLDRIALAGRDFTEDFIFSEGYTYLAIEPNKAVTEHFGPTPPDGERARLGYGVIESAADAWTIIQDASRFLRDPSTFDAAGFDAPAPVPVEKVMASGYSQTAMALHTMLRDGHNFEMDGSLVFDGMFLISAGVLCQEWMDSNPPTYYANTICPESPSYTGPTKVIHVNEESDIIVLGAAVVRPEFTVDPSDEDCAAGPGPDCDPNPNYISYELAGVAHIPGAFYDMAELMQARKQNPADPRPFFRARMRDLYEWVENDVRPPPPIPMAGSFDANFNFTPEAGPDGNLLGGIRLPHMPSTLDNGMPAGAPLGVYSGVDFTFILSVEPFVAHTFAALAGSFEPYTQEQLDMLYPTDDAYRALVTAAADDLLAKGYIMQADRDAYAAGAKPLPYPIPTVEDPDFTPKPKSGCSATGATDFPGMLVLVAAAWFVMRRKTSR